MINFASESSDTYDSNPSPLQVKDSSPPSEPCVKHVKDDGILPDSKRARIGKLSIELLAPSTSESSEFLVSETSPKCRSLPLSKRVKEARTKNTEVQLFVGTATLTDSTTKAETPGEVNSSTADTQAASTDRNDPTSSSEARIEEFERTIDLWLENNPDDDNFVNYSRRTFAAKIKEAFRDQTGQLEVRSLKLLSLPPEIGELRALIDLNFHMCHINTLPNTIGQLENLQTLDLDSNTLTNLPESIGQLTDLKHLILKCNGINTLPDTLGRVTALTLLSLEYNKLRVLPDSLGQLTNLNDLNLSRNLLNALPDSLGQLRNLKRLGLFDNQLRTIPEAIGELTALTYLSLAGNPLETVPESIGQLTNLIELGLNNNELRVLPESIGQLTALKTLNLSTEYFNLPRTTVDRPSVTRTGNQLSSLPDSFGRLTSLIRLDLSSNQLSSLPDSFGRLTNLTHLDLSGNQLKALPESIGELTQLNELLMRNNQLSVVPDSIGQLTGLPWLDLDNNQLSALPESIGKLTQLNELLIRNNQLTVVPDSIVKLTKLTSLDLSGNRFRTLSATFAFPFLSLSNNQLNVLPESVEELAGVLQLDLSHNQLSALPDSFGQWTDLIDLDVSNNQLSTLPDSFGQLTNLRELDLSNNQLSALPDSFEQWTDLIDLDLSNNQLSALPDSFGQFTNLRKLNLSKNQLSALPDSLGQLIELEELRLFGNPIQNLPMSLLALTSLTLIVLARNSPQHLRDQRNALLDVCKVHRKKVAQKKLPALLSMWTTYAKEEFDLKLVVEMEEEHQGWIYEWLIRLATTRDFSRHQQELAKNACSMLASLNTHPDFRAAFLDTLNPNNEACGDRASMTFNILYVSWKIHTLNANAPQQDTIDLLTGLAKTLTLRKVLSNLISAHERKQNSPERESVEIYLYYETSLKNKLRLVTAIEDMAYAEIGKRDWISKGELVNKVNEQWCDEFIDLEPFRAILLKDKTYMDALEAKSPERSKFSDDFLYAEAIHNLRRELALDWISRKGIKIKNNFDVHQEK